MKSISFHKIQNLWQRSFAMQGIKSVKLQTNITKAMQPEGIANTFPLFYTLIESTQVVHCSSPCCIRAICDSLCLG